MFEKLLSLLPYNPGLAHQMAFYARRMHEEAAIRRTGLIFMVLAFMVQFFAVLNPPQPTVAANDNNLISGGISSAADAKHHCSNNIRNYGDIMKYYGISCADIGQAETVTISSTAHDGNLFSMGHNPQGPRNVHSGIATHEVPANVPSAGTLYFRALHSFDTNGHSSYKALRLKSSLTGHTFWILFDCGNLVGLGVPVPVEICRYNPDILASSRDCFKPCRYNSAVPADSPRCVAPPVHTATPVPTTTPPPVINLCQYDKTLPADSPACFPPCQYNASIPSTDAACKPCEKSSSAQDNIACISVHKTAANITTGASDANGTTANPGDVITYTLYAQNSGKATVSQFVFQENLSDVMDYADPADLHGGTLGAEKIAVWPGVDIPAGQTVSVAVTIKVKDPVPQTPGDPADPAHFDLVMTNVYGNTINIKLPGSPAKTIETTTAALPNTGPGASLALAAGIIMLAGYFYARARLLEHETALALQENAAI